MAQKVRVLLIDDIDGSDAEETVTFGLDGVTYEIDLNAKNAAKLRDDLASWVGAGRRSGGRKSTGRKAGGARSGSSDAQKIREWAKQNGYKVSERGRVSAEIREAYAKAH
ncbi:histone-like nucleoid-structuring protein Lsr2 [Ruania halotolerans]|uniref:histone-like nucleoid-structuring protein Lsr2 n=1 Tax=Ruania halotolerans TaxID=2897773 RepID=UPI001E2D7178|nr:Lsr2 family protein [Ruania halotolerans]UFU07178.1 Lsr2 family protein [Ruania halotolerans]